MTSEGAININYIVNVLYAQVEERSKNSASSLYNLYVQTLNCDGSSKTIPADNFSDTPKVGDILLTIITTKTQVEPIYLYGDEAEKIWQEFLSKVNNFLTMDSLMKKVRVICPYHHKLEVKISKNSRICQKSLLK